MTREEAIAFFRDMNECTYGNLEAVEMAIKALEQEPCEDAISREATLKPYNELNDEDTICVWLIRKNIEQQPSVNPQKIGHWIKYGKLYQCSECKELSCCQGKFCNECGAKMVELQESEVEE